MAMKEKKNVDILISTPPGGHLMLLAYRTVFNALTCFQVNNVELTYLTFNSVRSGSCADNCITSRQLENKLRETSRLRTFGQREATSPAFATF